MFRNLVFILFSSWFLFACQETPQPNKNIPVAPDSSLGFSARINGGFFTTQDFSYSKLSYGYLLVARSNNEVVFEFKIDTLKVSTYKVTSKAFPFMAYTTPGSNKISYIADTGATLTIQSITGANQALRGTFSFKGTATSNGFKVDVSEGKFENMGLR